VAKKQTRRCKKTQDLPLFCPCCENNLHLLSQRVDFYDNFFEKSVDFQGALAFMLSILSATEKMQLVQCNPCAGLFK